MRSQGTRHTGIFLGDGRDNLLNLQLKQGHLQWLESNLTGGHFTPMLNQDLDKVF
jgi:hypothetical protein